MNLKIIVHNGIVEGVFVEKPAPKNIAVEIIDLDILDGEAMDNAKVKAEHITNPKFNYQRLWP